MRRKNKSYRFTGESSGWFVILKGLLSFTLKTWMPTLDSSEVGSKHAPITVRMSISENLGDMLARALRE